MKGVALMAEQQKYLASWLGLPCSLYCRYDIKWVGCTCPWQILAPILPGPQSEPGNELISPGSDIKPHSLYHQSHWIREPIQEGWQVHQQGKCLVQILIHPRLRRLSLDPSLRKIKLSSYHDRDCKIAIDWLLDVNERDTVSIWAHGLEWYRTVNSIISSTQSARL